MYARVYVEHLALNLQMPGDDRDEVYFMVGGESHAGRISKPRIPEPPHTYRGDDYYGLHAGETANDTDELNNPITLYQNDIDYNQYLSLAVVMREQDGGP